MNNLKKLDSMSEDSDDDSDGDEGAKKRTPKPAWIREGSATRNRHEGCSGKGPVPTINFA